MPHPPRRLFKEGARNAPSIYQPGERVGWTITRPAGAAGPSRFIYDVKKNGFDVLKSGSLDLTTSPTWIIALRTGNTARDNLCRHDQGGKDRCGGNRVARGGCRRTAPA